MITKLNLSQKFMLLFTVILTITSCSTEEIDIDFRESNNFIASKSYESYLDDAMDLKAFSESIINEVSEKDLENTEAIEKYVLTSVSKSGKSNLNYLNESFYKDALDNFRKNSEEITLVDTGLSQKALNYFSKLESFQANSDYISMVDLLDAYKLDYTNDSDLESLANVFSIIEVYKNDILNAEKSSQCGPSGTATAGAAVSGAISGAIWGFKLGSFLGPAGSVLGTVGGAIVGAAVSTIVSVGVQGVACEAQN